MEDETTPLPVRAIAVVGAGPRGTSLLERIAANAVPGSHLLVHVVDPHPPGAGAVWRVEQQHALLMNTPADDATLFTDDTVQIDGPVIPGPTLREWARAESQADVSAWLTDDLLLLEARAVRERVSPSRRLYGAYLRWFFETAARSLREAGAELILHTASATQLEDTADGRQRLVLSDGTAIEVDTVALALGHVAPPTTGLSARPAGGPLHIAAGNVSDQPLHRVRAGESVIVRGLGLGFYDVIASVTHGRGGVFERLPDGLVYRASGEEPVLWAGSRRGFPFRGKSRLALRPSWQRRYPGDHELASLRARRGSIDLRRDLWPAVAKEAAYRFLTAELSEANDTAAAAEIARITDTFDSHPWGDELRKLLRGEDGRLRYDPELRGDPLRGRIFPDLDTLGADVTRLLREDVAESWRGASSASKSADRAVGASRAWMFDLVAFGGLAPGSHRDDFERWFDGYANSIAGGPPAERVEELLALAEAGIVRFLGAGLRISRDGDEFVAGSTSVPDAAVRATALIDAHLAPLDVAGTSDPLLRRLHDSGAIRSFSIEDGAAHHRTGGLDVDPVTHAVIDADGRARLDRFAIGIPVGPYVNTSLSAIARTNSQFLRQTDAVARSLLGAHTGRTIQTCPTAPNDETVTS